MEDGIESTILIIVMLIVVLLSAYYVTKFLAKRGKRLTQSKHIKVIDQIYMATDKQIALIDVGGKSILVGITNQAINYIAELDMENIETLQEQPILVKNLPNKIVNIVKNAKKSQEELRKTRRQSRRKIHHNRMIPLVQEDDFDAMMKAITNKKRQFAEASKEGIFNED